MTVMRFLIEGDSGAGGEIWTWVIMLGALAFIFYFLMLRPQKKERQRHQRMIESLRKNDKIVTMGGIHGTVVSVKENIVVMRIDDNSDVKLSINRSSIGVVVAPDDEEDFEKKD